MIVAIIDGIVFEPHHYEDVPLQPIVKAYLDNKQLASLRKIVDIGQDRVHLIVRMGGCQVFGGTVKAVSVRLADEPYQDNVVTFRYIESG